MPDPLTRRSFLGTCVTASATPAFAAADEPASRAGDAGIIDCHVHLKHGDAARTEWSAESIVELMDKVGIGRAIVFAMSTTTVRSIEMDKAAAEKYPERLIPFVYALPSYERPVLKDIETAIVKHGFRGIKIHAGECRLAEYIIDPVLRLASLFPVPCLVDVAGNASVARRLAETGTAVTSLYINTPKRGQEFTNWDDHILNAQRPGHFGKYMRIRLPYMDQALSALIEDVYNRGLDQKIMIVVMGEFGRTPRLRVNANGTGRNHWPQAYTALVSGGGLRMGQVIGSTNSKAEHPVERPYTPQDMLATVYRHLGIDYHHKLVDYSGRPVAILGQGEPIRELI